MIDITEKWTGRRKDWGQIHSQLEIFFAGRLPQHSNAAASRFEMNGSRQSSSGDFAQIMQGAMTSARRFTSKQRGITACRGCHALQNMRFYCDFAYKLDYRE
jgi:hypothetical protein